MPKFTPPKGYGEALEFELMGQTFVVSKVPERALVAMRGITGEETQYSTMIEVLRLLINDDARFNALGELDMRQVFPLFLWIAEQITAGLGDAEKKSPRKSSRSSESSTVSDTQS